MSVHFVNGRRGMEASPAGNSVQIKTSGATPMDLLFANYSSGSSTNVDLSEGDSIWKCDPKKTDIRVYSGSVYVNGAEVAHNNYYNWTPVDGAEITFDGTNIYIVEPVTPTGYNLSYSTAHGKAPSPVSDVTELTDAMLPTLTAAGYIFQGWFYESTFATQAQAGDTLSADTTLYAKWKLLSELKSFYIEALESITVALSKYGSPTIGNGWYAVDDASFADYTYGTAISLSEGQKIYFAVPSLASDDTDNQNLISFDVSGKFNVGGNLSSLIGGLDYIPRNYCFYSLFGVIPVVDASNLTLISNLNNKSYVYYSMFARCSDLIALPQLPSTTLSLGCYYYMFDRCTALRSLPELPATTLYQKCYYGMFSECSNIKLSLTEEGYYQIPYRIPTAGVGTASSESLDDMFEETGGTWTGTPSINTTYYLYGEPPATNLNVTYDGVNIINGLEVTPPVTVTYNGSTIATLADGDRKTLSCNGKIMASDVSIGSKVLKCNGLLATSDIEVSLSGALPYLAFKATSAGTTVSMESYDIVPNVDLEYSFDMRSWTPFVVDVTEVSIPNGSTLYLRGNNETISTGRDNYIKFVMTGSIEASGFVQSLLDKTCKKMDLPDYCFNRLFTGCSSLQTTPELTATTLGDYCYYRMFQNCTSLTKPSHLVATVLPDYCYSYMFTGCRSILLSATQGGTYQTAYRIPAGGTGSEGYNSLANMFSNTGGSFKSTPSINKTYYGAW